MNAITLAFALLGSHLVGLAAANWQPNFSQTCTNIGWKQNKDKSVVLTATCHLSGSNTTSTLNLGACVGVDSGTGVLIGQDNGKFGSRSCGCGDGYQETANSTLSCTCSTNGGEYGYVASTFDLDQVVGNTAGTLYCYSTLGTAISS